MSPVDIGRTINLFIIIIILLNATPRHIGVGALCSSTPLSSSALVLTLCCSDTYFLKPPAFAQSIKPQLKIEVRKYSKIRYKVECSRIRGT